MSAVLPVVAVVAAALVLAALVAVVLDRTGRCRCQREEPLASLDALAAVTAGVRRRSRRDARL